MYNDQIRIPVFSDAQLREFISVSTWTYVRGTLLANDVDLDAANTDLLEQVSADVNDIIDSIYSSVSNAKGAFLKEHPNTSPEKLAAFVWWFLPRCGQVMLDKFINGYGLRRVQVELSAEEKEQHAELGLRPRLSLPPANSPAI
jgi:hypothetical protein